MKRLLLFLLGNILLAGLYYASARAGLSLATVNPSVTPVWPGTGIAIAALLLFRPRLWPGVWAGAFWVNYTTLHELMTAAGIASGNTLEGLVAIVLIRQFAGGTRVFERSVGVFRYILYAAVIGCATGATIGVSVLQVAGKVLWPDYGLTWLTWWLGDAVSALTVAPLIVVWSTRPPAVRRVARVTELGALIVVATGVSLAQWGPWLPVAVNRLPMGYIVIPSLLWSAFRFYQHGAVTVVFITCAIAVWGTLAGRGPFAVADFSTALLLLQSFSGTLAVTGLIMAAVVAEHSRVEAVQRESEHRLRQLAESEQAARREAELASRTKDHFLAVLSHELRTPLTPVLLILSLLKRRTDLANDLKEDLQTIERNVELEARLIDDLLDLTRVARGKLQLSRETTDVHALMIRALEICGRPEGVDVDVDLSAKDHVVRGDPARLQQVFWNLLTNARKFTPRGGTIRVRSRNSQERKVRFEVSDTGIGIDPQLLPKLFNAFEQGDELRAKKAGGLGLGLAISRALVVAHGGNLTAASAGKNRGSTFVVELPTLEQPAGRTPPTPQPTPSVDQRAAATTTPARSLNVLLVEDDQPTQRAMSRLLTEMGHTFRVARSVRTALDLASREHFDLLISDLGLPDGSGHDLMRALRRRSPDSIRAICVSGYGMEDDIRKSREAGFNQHLTKPISLDRLEAVIAKVTETTAPRAG